MQKLRKTLLRERMLEQLGHENVTVFKGLKKVLEGVSDDVLQSMTATIMIACDKGCTYVQADFEPGLKEDEAQAKANETPAPNGKTPEQIAQKYPSEYRSAVMHFGNLHEAFGILGIEYQFPRAALDWRNKVLAFVGKLPDTEIARVTGVSATTIRHWRQHHKIPAYNRRDELENILNNL